jgi:hypothetical protein
VSTMVAEILDEAARIIERDGLVKGQYYGTFGISAVRYDGSGACAIGAIRVACIPYYASVDNAEAAIFPNLIAFRAEDVEPKIENLAEWSDDPSRTQAEVMERFRRAAAVERTR